MAAKLKRAHGKRSKPADAVVAWILALLCLSCGSEKKDAPDLFTLMPRTGIQFRNDVIDSKDDNGFLFRNFYNGGGVAIGDLNNDGLPEVFLTSNQGENKLYTNKGALQFEDISQKAGLEQDSMWSTGATMADVNADGWLDIYVCNSGHMQDGNRRNKLYINNKDLTFTESAAAFGLSISGYCTQASFFDYDLDGDLDCFIINNSPIPFSSLEYAGMRDLEVSKWKIDEKLKGGGNHLYQNTGDVFREVTAEAGLHSGLISFGLGLSVGDINADGYPDIYVGNDFIEKDYLYINQKNGTFRDELEARIQKISMSSMSSDLADINNDGLPEIFTTDMIPDDDYRLKTTGTFDNIDLYTSKLKAGLYHQYVRNSLQLNNGDGQFSEIANFAGVSGTDWSWGSVFLDADNDGHNDIFVCNGIARDVGDLDFLDFFSNEVYAEMMSTGKPADMDALLKNIPATPLANRVFKNTGSLQFDDIGQEWGFREKSFSNSVAYGDLDNDGDLDLVINNANSPAFVYRNNRNTLPANNFIAVRLESPGKNRFALGSKIKIFAGREVYYRELIPVRGFQSSMDYQQLVGLGAHVLVDSLVVTWPDRTTTTVPAPRVNAKHTIRKSNNVQATAVTTPTPSRVLFRRVAAPLEQHTEDEYLDFYFERNLPAQLSREGPQVATGDVNNDGREDFFIGGGRGQEGQLYLQGPDGTLLRKRCADFAAYKDFEDIAVLFFDADRDGDLDLFAGAGGNNIQVGARQAQHRLFRNDGAGNFKVDVAAFPNNDMNISVAVADDFDSDGDEDLFVGGRSVPFAYGMNARSYLYQNNGTGIFKDVTGQVCPALTSMGMVTGAVWADVSGDKKKELIVTGEWMPTSIFSQDNNRFVQLRNTGLSNLHGLWQSVAAADLDGDGRTDLVLGNIGDNFYLKPGKESPAKIWVGDLDGNGTTDQFLTRSINGKDMPVFLRREITEQFPGLKKNNLKHSEYASKSIGELFDKKILGTALIRQFNYSASVVAHNSGNGTFKVTPLPLPVQLSSVNAICPFDLDGDGRADLITGGNLFNFPPQFGRLDASYGNVLINNGKGFFTCLPGARAGLNLRGAVKSIRPVRILDAQHFIATQNGGYPVLFQRTN